MHTKQIVNCTTSKLLHKSLCSHTPEKRNNCECSPRKLYKCQKSCIQQIPITVAFCSRQNELTSHAKLCTYHQSSKQKPPLVPKSVSHQFQFQKIPMAEQVAQKDERNCLQVGSPFGLRYHASGSGLFSSTKASTIWSCHSHATKVKTCYTSHQDLCCVIHECCHKLYALLLSRRMF